MSGESYHLVIEGVGIVFAAGIFYATVKTSLHNLKDEMVRDRQCTKEDVDGIGKKVNDSDAKAARRYHNVSMAIIHGAPTEKEASITHMLKEN